MINVFIKVKDTGKSIITINRKEVVSSYEHMECGFNKNNGRVPSQKNTKNTRSEIIDPENEIRSPSNSVESQNTKPFESFLGGEKNLAFRNLVFFIFFCDR